MQSNATQSSSNVVVGEELCPHFGECGGCASQDIAYDTQLVNKQAALQTLFDGLWDAPIAIKPSPVIWNYRNKVDFNFAPRQYPEPPPKDFQRETVVGFTRKGQWYWPLDVTECRIGPEGTPALLDAVRNWYRKEGLHAFDSRKKQGLLRVLLVREGKRTGERMVGLFTSEGDFDRQGFVDAVQAAFPAHSIYHGISRGTARGAFADELELLHGAPTIHEEILVPDGGEFRKIRFSISPMSFFQTNTLATETLYGEIRNWVKKISPTTLYDLYGGAGGIAFSCSDLVETVRSIENEPAATRDGQSNAKENNIDNVFFTTEKMRNYLRILSESGGMETNSAVVVDPPREGMTPKPLKRLLECRPPHILYVSCKPTVLREELDQILQVYELTSLAAVDLFPHTPHVEVLAALRIR